MVERAVFEGTARRVLGLSGDVGAMGEGGHGIGQGFFGLVNLGPLQGLQAGDFIEWHFGKQPQEAGHGGVLGVTPELPKIIRRTPLGVEPNRPLRGFAHLFARGQGDQRRCQTKNTLLVDPAGQFHAVDDIAPLVGATD